MSGSVQQTRVVQQTRYYDAHCSGCGELTSADLLAFDFGRLVNKAIVRAYERPLGGTDKWLPLLQVDLAMYFTWRDLAQIYRLVEGEFSRFTFTVANLKSHIHFLTGISFSEIESQKGIDNVVYNTLRKKIKTPLEEGKKATHQDIDIMSHAENIKNIIDMCRTGRASDDEVIAEFDVKVVMEEDDNGNPFPKKLVVRYDDGTPQTEAVIHNVCPHCGKRFYSRVGKYEEIIICMAGSARVGKTAYLAALVDRIEKYGGHFATVIPNTQDEDWRFFEERILQAYQRGEKIDKTAFEGSGETIPLFSLEIKIVDKHYIFTFIDMPGEAFDSMDDNNAGVNFIVNDRKIVNYAQMIWFCVAPQQVDAKLAELSNITSADQDRVNTKTNEVMGNIQSTFEAVCVDGKKNAVVLVTMSDMIQNQDNNAKLFDPTVNVFAEYLNDENQLDYKKFKEFSDRTFEYLDRARNIMVTVEDMFEKFNAFAVAAYGQEIADVSPGLAELLQTERFEAAPSMVELPFIWTLAALGKLQALKMVPVYEKKKILGFIKTDEDVYKGEEPRVAAISELYR